MSFEDLVRADRRLVILRLLAQSGDYRGNAFLLQTALDGFGHAVSMDCLKTDLAWLAEQGLIRVEVVGSVTIAQAVQAGLDVASGRSVVPGVKRPAPGA